MNIPSAYNVIKKEPSVAAGYVCMAGAKGPRLPEDNLTFLNLQGVSVGRATTKRHSKCKQNKIDMNISMAPICQK